MCVCVCDKIFEHNKGGGHSFTASFMTSGRPKKGGERLRERLREREKDRQRDKDRLREGQEG